MLSVDWLMNRSTVILDMGCCAVFKLATWSIVSSVNTAVKHGDESTLSFLILQITIALNFVSIKTI